MIIPESWFIISEDSLRFLCYYSLQEKTMDYKNIHVRKPDFRLQQKTLQEFIGSDPVRAHFLNSLSTLFPEGEKFFIETVRNYKEQITDRELAEAVKRFSGQETVHTNEHIVYNNLIDQCGYSTGFIGDRLKNRVEYLKKIISQKRQLAATLALEHYTASLAHLILTDKSILEGIHPEIHKIWNWHAMEEIEHKAVAFDVYTAIGGGYFTRISEMLVVSVFFFSDLFANMIYFLNKDGKLFHLPTLAKAFAFFWIGPGIFRKLVPLFLEYFSPRFHPWNRNNSRLLADWSFLQQSGEKKPLATG